MASDEQGTNRLSSSTWGNATVGSTQRHMVCTLPPTTDYQYRVPLFHVKPAAGCGLIRFLRRRASASWQERGPVPTETVAPMRVRPASV